MAVPAKMALKQTVWIATCHMKATWAIYFNGISEVTYMLTHDAKDQPWQENRKKRAKFIYDSGCLSCHKTNSSNANITDMHAIYSKFKDDTKNKLDCVSCHKNVGHNDLGKILYKIKHPPVGNW